MRRYMWLLAFALLVGTIWSAPFDRDRSEAEDETNAVQELSAKQELVQNDVRMTERLCRLQCRSDLGRLAHAWQDGEADVDSFMQEHPHIEALRHVGGEERAYGNQAVLAEAKFAPSLHSAEQAVAGGQWYESESVAYDGESYVVMGAPLTEGGLVAVIHQDILDRVREHQRKNLRVVPYPSDARYQMESVDSDTGRDVKVDHPEENEGTSHYMRQEVVVKFRQPPTEAELARMREAMHATTKTLGYTYVFSSRQHTLQEMIDYFEHLDVEYVEPHWVYMTNETAVDPDLAPNDALFAEYQWNLPQIETLSGWATTKGSEDVIVAVIDTGTDLDHPDLHNRLVEGVNVVNPELPPDDDVGHGTHVSGVVSASVDNVEGVAGMSWYNRVMPVKVLDETGAGSTYAVAQGIIWATDHGAKVINMSLGNYADAQFLHDAIRYAFDRDVVLVAAAGNDNTGELSYPAAYPEVVAVAATDWGREKSVFSNYGEHVDVAAPGESIASTYMQGQYAALSGTSMASPHVAALAGLIRSINPELRNTEVMDIIRQTADDLGDEGPDPYYGYGLINVARALEQADAAGESLLNWSARSRRAILDALN